MTANEIISKVRDLPMVPETARKLITLLNQPDTHRDDLIQTLRCDNVLTAKMLRVCNSVHIGARNPIGSIDQAVLMLGDNTIYRMVCAISFGGAMGFSTSGRAIEADGLWVHSLSTGMGAEYLSEIQAYGDFQPSVAFTAGLLHEIGLLVLNQFLTVQRRTEIGALISQDGLSRIQAEKLVLGTNHAEVGACLLQRWGLPDLIVEAVAHHHAPLIKPSLRLSAVIYLADCAAHLSRESACDSDQDAELLVDEMAEKLCMEPSEVEQIVDSAQEAMKSVEQFLAVA